MSHLIVEGIDVVYTPASLPEYRGTWHSLETPVDPIIQTDLSNVPDAMCPIIEVGIKPDFDGTGIEESDIEREAFGEELSKEMGKWKLLVADCRKGKAGKVIPLHVPRDGYKVHQNKLNAECMIKAADKVLGAGNYVIATLGTLGAWTQFFISIAIKGMESFKVGNNDIWNRFFNLNSSHNGLISSHRMLSLVRMVCMNTVQASISDAESHGSITRVKHTANSDFLLTPEVFAKDLETWVKRGEQVRLMLEAIKAESMTVDEFKSFSAGVFTSAKSDNLSTNSFNRINEMVPLFQRGLGNDVNEPLSRYKALNAFTEFFTSGAGVGSKDVSLGKRIASANFGRGNDWKLEALRVLTTPEAYEESVKRGEMLFADKLKLEATSN